MTQYTIYDSATKTAVVFEAQDNLQALSKLMKESTHLANDDEKKLYACNVHLFPENKREDLDEQLIAQIGKKAHLLTYFSIFSEPIHVDFSHYFDGISADKIHLFTDKLRIKYPTIKINDNDFVEKMIKEVITAQHVGKDYDSDKKNKCHYLGIPLNIYVYFDDYLKTNKLTSFSVA